MIEGDCLVFGFVGDGWAVIYARRKALSRMQYEPSIILLSHSRWVLHMQNGSLQKNVSTVC